MRHEGALGGGAVLGAAVRGGGAGVRQAAVLLVRGARALVPLAQLVRDGGAARALVVGAAVAAQRRSPQDLRARRRQAARVALVAAAPALPEQAAGRVRVGGLELRLDAVVALLVALQAAHHHGRGAALHVQRVLLDAVLRAGLALAVQVDAVAVAAAARRQVGHAARVRRAQRARRPLPLPLPRARLGRRVLGQRGVVGIHLRRVVVLRARVAGARRAVVHGVRAVAAASPWRVEVGAPRVVLRAQELALGLQAGAPVPKVQGEAVQPRGAEVHRPAGRPRRAGSGGAWGRGWRLCDAPIVGLGKSARPQGPEPPANAHLEEQV